MTLRVSQATYYRQTMNDIVRMRYQLYQLNSQGSSGKVINNPSDDPVGSITSQSASRSLEEVSQYSSNLLTAYNWLAQADSTMQSMSEYISQIKAKAEQASTGTYTSDQLGLIATEVDNMFAHLLSLANSQVEGKYIYAGTANNLPAASSDLLVDSPTTAGAANTGAGLVYGQGAPTCLTSRTVTLTIAQAPAGGVPTVADPMTVDYSYVDDYGRTISGTVQLTGTGSGFGVDVGDGVQIYVDQGAFATGDAYTLQVGRSQGNEEELSTILSQDVRLTYNFSLDDLYGEEGYSDGQWSNILDLLARWSDALNKDSEEQDYFETVPGVTNNPSSSAELQVSGDYDVLNNRQVSLQVGGPIQFIANDLSADDATVSDRSYQFYLEPGGNTGLPSEDNPVTLRYYYWDGAAWTDGGTVTVTGTGSDNPVVLNDNGGDVSIYMAQASFDESNMTTFAAAPTGGPPPTADAGTSMTVYADDTEPSTANPRDVTYSFLDDSGVRRYGTVTFTGTGEDAAWSVPLSDATLQVVSNVDTDTLSERQYEFYLDDATFTGTPSAANPMDLHYRYWDGTAWVDGGAVTVTGTGPEHQVTLSAINAGEDVRIYLADGSYDSSSLGVWPAGTDTTSPLTMNLEGERATLTIAEGGTVDDGDYYAATLEQYKQGQTASQEILAQLESLQANLLKNLGDAGSRLSGLEARDQLLESDTLRLTDRLSGAQDADLTEVLTNLQLYQNLFEASLKATAMVTSKTLADYL